MDLTSRLKGKNPNRVLPQLRRTLKIQRARVLAACVTSVLLLTVLAMDHFLPFLPWAVWFGLVLVLPFSIFAILADYGLYRIQAAEVSAIENGVKQQIQPTPPP